LTFIFAKDINCSGKVIVVGKNKKTELPSNTQEKTTGGIAEKRKIDESQDGIHVVNFIELKSVKNDWSFFI